MAKQTVTVSVLADSKPLRKEFAGLGEKLGLGKLGAAVKKLGKALAVGAAGLGAGVAAIAVPAVSAAADLEQSIGAVDAVFKENADTIHAWAKDAATELGLTRDQYNGLATSIGTQLKNAGVPMEDLAGQTDELLRRSADLAAMFGGPVTDSSAAVAAALRGEMEPLRRYGISLSQAEIQARALADTGKSNADALTAQEKALATQALIFEQSADAAGQFSREQDTLAGKTERLKAQVGNFTAEIGTALLPIVTELVGWLAEQLGPAMETVAAWAQESLVPALRDLATWLGENVVPALQSFGTWLQDTVLPAVQQLGAWLLENVVPALQDLGTYLTETVVPALIEFGQWVQDNRAWLEPLAVAVLAMVAAYKAWTAATVAWEAITKLATIAQRALNAAMRANPIGIVITALTGLVAAIVYLWNTNDGFREALIKAWNAIKGAVTGVWDWLRYTAVPAIGQAIGSAVDFITSLPGKAVQALAGIGTTLLGKGRALIQGLRDGITEKVKALMGYFKFMPRRIAGWLSDAGSWLWNVGKDVIRGLINGIKSMGSTLWNSIVRLVSDNLPGPVKAVLGISSPSRLFASFGRDTMRGLVQGLELAAPAVGSTMRKLSQRMANTPLQLRGELAVEAEAARARNRTPRTPVQVTVQTLDGTSPSTARAVVDALREFERTNGPVFA